MKLSTNTIIKSAVIVLATIISTSTATFAHAEVDIKPDGSMNSRPSYPTHWGQPPRIQTRDFVELPEPYGKGSGTLKKWIEEKMEEDAAAADEGTERRFADPSATETSSSKWPDTDLTGMTGEEAKQEINSVDPSLEVHILPEDSMVTMDYREDRVRIFVNDAGQVSRQPNKG